MATVTGLPLDVFIAQLAESMAAEACERILLAGRTPPTHRCKVCGALWTLHPATRDRDALWQLFSSGDGAVFAGCGVCCDNVAMGDQIESLEDA